MVLVFQKQPPLVIVKKDSHNKIGVAIKNVCRIKMRESVLNI